MNKPIAPSQSSVQPDEPIDIVNFRALHNWLHFGLRSLSRHKWIALLVAGSILVLASLVLAVLPKKYHVEAQLLAQKNQVLALPGDGPGSEAPTRAAGEVVMRRENLENLVKQTNLVEEWPKRQAPLQRFTDRVMSWFGDAPTDAEVADMLVEQLQERMQAWSHEGTVTIQVYWPDPQMAYRLVDGAQRAFLEARHVQEISTVAESAAILQGHAAVLRREIDEAVVEIEALREKRLEEHKKSVEKTPRRVTHTTPVSDQGALPSPVPKSDARGERRLSELAVMIEAKQRAVRELEEYRQRRMVELQTRLSEKRLSYTDAHPEVNEVKQAISAASEPSPQVTTLQAQLRTLKDDYERVRASLPANGGVVPPASALGQQRSKALPNQALPALDRFDDDEDDPASAYAKARLRFAIENYQQLQDQIRAAQINLDTAQAAFKYRYTVVRPAEVPKAPISPKSSLILIAALVAGLVLGVVTSVGLDLRGGTIYDRWQVEQLLALPVVADIRLLPKSSQDVT
jgi:uncharacterized protein involved in exopolysaccharide biosynthesis